MKKLLFIVFPAVISCIRPEPKAVTPEFIRPSSDSIRYTGRIKSTSDSVTIYWPGTSILVQFKGKSLKAILRDERGENYFNVIIDGDSLRYFKPDSVKSKYELAAELSDGTHLVELIKRNESHTGKTWFYGFEVEGGTLMPLPESRNRIIEFFGDSITAGYALEDTTGGDSPEGPFTNNYYTYAALTARHFKADYYCTAKSGIGIMVSWFPLIMPEMYNRLDPSDSSSRWNFKSVQPDIVVINLFQNDSWLVKQPQHQMFKKRFGTSAPSEKQIIEAYRTFLQQIRSVYPETHIICALGNMDITKENSPWPGYVKDAVSKLEDPRMHTVFFPFAKTSGHPRKEENKDMANILISFIEKNIQW